MQVFVTGASGYVGTAVTQELLANGHQVTGLARSDESARKLEDLGASVRRGNLDDTAGLAQAARMADGVIHLAFIHDFTNFAASAAADKAAIEAMGTALSGSGKTFVVTSGTAGLAPGRIATEDDTFEPGALRTSEASALAFVDKHVRVSAVRLSPTVHSDRDAHGFIPTIIQVARDKGVSGYPADGANRWSAVHVLDAARLFRLALEQAPAGARLHGVAEEAITSRQIAEVIGEQLNLQVQSVPSEQAMEHFGWIGRFFTMDVPASSLQTQAAFDWQPVEIGLIEDLQTGNYFRN